MRGIHRAWPRAHESLHLIDDKVTLRLAQLGGFVVYCWHGLPNISSESIGIRGQVCMQNSQRVKLRYIRCMVSEYRLTELARRGRAGGRAWSERQGRCRDS